MEQAQLVETADERGCTRMSGAAHRRESACIGGCLPTAVRGSLYRLLARTKFTKWSNLASSQAQVWSSAFRLHWPGQA